MLLREDSHGMLAIGQASHAWLSGQLARAWGNARFGELEPREEVCLAAEQHDVGMAAWDLAPTHNPDTGLPHSFMEMPLATHLELWRAGPSRLLSQSRYAALLVSMHGTRLYERRDLSRLAPDEADAVRRFLEDGHAGQRRLAASLSGPASSAERLARNSDLIWTWDYLSLALCLDWAPCAAQAVPTSAGAVDVRLEPAGGPLTVTVDPWPFATAAEMSVRCEGRRLPARYATAEELERALVSAGGETLEFRLRRRD
jgi:hypothetical protein